MFENGQWLYPADFKHLFLWQTGRGWHRPTALVKKNVFTTCSSFFIFCWGRFITATCVFLFSYLAEYDVFPLHVSPFLHTDCWRWCTSLHYMCFPLFISCWVWCLSTTCVPPSSQRFLKMKYLPYVCFSLFIFCWVWCLSTTCISLCTSAGSTYRI